MALAAGTRLGPYEILDLVGAGGMGEVYRARDPRLGRDVAIKVLPAEVGADTRRLSRFEREARAVASLNHPSILTVFDVGTQEGVPYVVTELLEGATLRTVLSHRLPTQRQILSLCAQVAHGLEAAHAKGIVHRDVKPENLFLATDGRVKILDFGLAKLLEREAGGGLESTESSPTAAGHVLGTIGYASPEQVRAIPVDARTDIFSLGVVLYELLSGRHPFRQETTVATLAAILETTPPDLALLGRAVSPALSGIVRRCLEKRREDRFHSAHDLALALETVAEAASGASSPEGMEERSPYPGLTAFTEEDAGLFFGREAEIEALWLRLQSRRLLAVIGPSGAGKTSFVRAGVIAAAPEGWRCLWVSPGNRPFPALVRALVPELSSDPETLQRLVGAETNGELVAAIGLWRRRHGEVLLVVDQLEELFTLNSGDVQERYAALLGQLASEADVRVLLSLRDDFLMRTQEQPPLRPILGELTALLPLSPDALRRAVVEPAKKRGYALEDEALVGEMVGSVEGARGALPLLAFAMSLLWEKRDRQRKLLTREAYEEIGGVAGALARHAEATLERIGTARQATAREIFRNLVTSHGTRAAADREELLSVFPQGREAEEVLRELIDARLVTSYEREAREGGPSHDRVELVHESLLKAWPRLVRWQAQDEDGAHLREQLKQAAHLWEEKGRTADLLWTGTSYQELMLWRTRYPAALSALEEDFARAMAKRARRRRRRRRAVVASVIVALTAVAIAIGLSRQQAMRARDRAQAEARRAEASKLLALGRAELDRYPTAAVAYARKSLEIADTPEGRRFAVDALWRSPTARILPVGHEVVWSADFSPDGRWLAAFAMSGRLLLLEDHGSPPRILPGQPPTGSPPRIRFTPSGDALLAQSREEARVRMYGVPDGREIRRFEPEPPGGYGAIPRPKPGSIAPMDWTPLPQGILFHWWPGKPSPGAPEPFGIWPYDGGPPRVIGSLRGSPAYAVVDARGSRFLLRRGPRLVLRPLGGDDAAEKPVVTLADTGPRWGHGFGDGGDRIWLHDIKGESGRLRVWSIGRAAPSEPRVLSMPSPAPSFDPAWDSTGSRVAWGSAAERGVWVWDLAGPPDAAPIVLRRPDAESVNQGVFAPTRDWLLVTHQGPLTLWALAQPWARVLTGHAHKVNRLQFTRDSHSLLSCGHDSVRSWPLGAGQGGARRIATEYHPWCFDAALSPDGHRLLLVGPVGAWLASSFDGRGRWLWGGRVEFPYAASAAAWDALGRRVAVGSGYAAEEPNAIGLFDLETGDGRTLSLVPPGAAGEGFDWGVLSLAFTPEGRLLAGGSGGVRWIDAETGASEWLWRLPKKKVAPFALGADGRRLVAASSDAGMGERRSAGWEVVSIDLDSRERRSIRSHGDGVTAVGLDAAGRTLVTGDEQGVVRVGLADGGEPHRLCCHAGKVTTVAVSPDGKWVASAAGSEIRLWPMPDLSRPPLHTLPHDELMAKLRSLTNLQVVEAAASPTGYRLDIGPFPGWKDAPTW
jgi:WD40 repeat protein